ncbi:hypothetical protein GIB67_027736 [Kingdonia uniflora]|uniref:Uncharacterized protein n=1 Tax=Kingdonia uniflora TaxID=39325 RepID=A0A7J7PBZ3_9MAGN|nr:hypothetical protein GIB67_027736 [Kingdonia uniflora]
MNRVVVGGNVGTIGTVCANRIVGLAAVGDVVIDAVEGTCVVGIVVFGIVINAVVLTRGDVGSRIGVPVVVVGVVVGAVIGNIESFPRPATCIGVGFSGLIPAVRALRINPPIGTPLPQPRPVVALSRFSQSPSLRSPSKLGIFVVKVLLQYYNSLLERDGFSSRIVKFGGVASITGVKASYTNSAPKVMYYSARGPDPQDNLFRNADILKPNLIAPGNSIWAAWSSAGADSVEFLGENFAMLSGSSMAAPHVAGLAALIKQKYPSFSPSAIGSALSTTASLLDKQGGSIMAQRSYSKPDLNQSPATPFDMGSGLVNATAALDPGLIFNSSYDNFFSFLCGINGSGPVVLNYTGQSCRMSTINATDLNLPSITIAKLKGSRTVQREVTNIANNETYQVNWSPPYGVSMSVTPYKFFIESGQRQLLTLLFNATINSTSASFGRIGLYGNHGHAVNIPISVVLKISPNVSDT